MPKNEPAASVNVTPSPAMVPPQFSSMLAKRDYPVNAEPPAAHARLWGDPVKRRYALTYNGFDIVEFEYLDDCKPALRFHSDGDFLSSPMIQQFVIAADRFARMRVTFRFPHEFISMRPRRAQNGEAILAQWGSPLLFGVNGLYSLYWDLLVSFHGYDFTWSSPRIEKQDGVYSASMTVKVGTKPFVVLLQPRYYGEHLGFWYHQPWLRRPRENAVSLWSSWEAYHSDVTQRDIENAAELLSPLTKYGLDTLQVDDGYQNELVPPSVGEPIGKSWLTTNEKVPGGHEAIVRAIRGAGFRAGIWTNATLTNREACEESDYCLRKNDGSLIKGDWIQYVIDCSPEMLKREITAYYRDLRRAGYTYFKSDALRHLIFDGLHEAVRLGLMDSKEADRRQRAYMRAAREGIGEDAYYLSCWGVLSQSVGICDAMRVATDANPSWRAFSMQLRETARWFFAQRVLFTVDPDHVCVRANLPWVRMMLSLVTLSGGLYGISDKPETYDEPRMELIRRTIPGIPVRTAETGPVDYSAPACWGIPGDIDPDQASREISHIDDAQTPFSSLWCTHFDDGFRSWAILHRCAVVPLEELTLPLSALALDGKRTYCAFNFWSQEASIVTNGELALPKLALGEDTVIALHDITGRDICLVGSDRHVSMDVVSVERFTANDGIVEMKLCGFEGLACVYTLYAPKLASHILRKEGCDAAADRSGDFLSVRVMFKGKAAQIAIGCVHS